MPKDEKSLNPLESSKFFQSISSQYLIGLGLRSACLQPPENAIKRLRITQRNINMQTIWQAMFPGPYKSSFYGFFYKGSQLFIFDYQEKWNKKMNTIFHNSTIVNLACSFTGAGIQLGLYPFSTIKTRLQIWAHTICQAITNNPNNRYFKDIPNGKKLTELKNSHLLKGVYPSFCSSFSFLFTSTAAYNYLTKNEQFFPLPDEGVKIFAGAVGNFSCVIFENIKIYLQAAQKSPTKNKSISELIAENLTIKGLLRNSRIALASAFLDTAGLTLFFGTRYFLSKKNETPEITEKKQQVKTP